MALDILTIPAMSAAPERIFSSANIPISDRRNRLHSDNTEAIERLKSWRKIQTVRLEPSIGPEEIEVSVRDTTHMH